ncbi:uncharacterized protein LOC116805884 [Drosophila grimshawi]|uniref:uncharacterized protein LOC116805884 n=1 Tax=Drosophila grimshawi TaxID=7222 RepID=UPI000C86FE6F|nr:uncharacterized protein LOC116805884 [Drosophila grimshawi]
MALFASIVLDTLVNCGIIYGIYGTVRNNTSKIKRFIFVLLIFFIGKITIAKLIAEFDDKDIEIIISIWYQFDVVLTGICLVCATPLCLKILEKENRSLIQV